MCTFEIASSSDNHISRSLSRGRLVVALKGRCVFVYVVAPSDSCPLLLSHPVITCAVCGRYITTVVHQSRLSATFSGDRPFALGLPDSQSERRLGVQTPASARTGSR
ncbi:hypothetical protein AALO_G00218270 [Alosa alosa]|uniref:Uncharacterized protein n=1 Tax=Alosa alosa TaxID=278164 RepID=A0AAV6G104_9TELE|nr:hypothetical protein AALO_G00218270 [Alosa alosa]